MGQLSKLGKRRRHCRTSIDRDHHHDYVLGKARTKNAVWHDDLAQLNVGNHHHPIVYDAIGNPTIGFAEGHDHQA